MACGFRTDHQVGRGFAFSRPPRWVESPRRPRTQSGGRCGSMLLGFAAHYQRLRVEGSEEQSVSCSSSSIRSTTGGPAAAGARPPLRAGAGGALDPWNHRNRPARNPHTRPQGAGRHRPGHRLCRHARRQWRRRRCPPDAPRRSSRPSPMGAGRPTTARQPDAAALKTPRCVAAATAAGRIVGGRRLPSASSLWGPAASNGRALEQHAHEPGDSRARCFRRSPLFEHNDGGRPHPEPPTVPASGTAHAGNRLRRSLQALGRRPRWQRRDGCPRRSQTPTPCGR
jgi:hypothetical protein